MVLPSHTAIYLASQLSALPKPPDRAALTFSKQGGSLDQIASLLLRRRGLAPLPRPTADAPADGAAWARALEAELVDYGWLLSANALERFSSLDTMTRIAWSDWLLGQAAGQVGADRDHQPLFRAFPTVPDTDALFVDRLLVHLFQDPGAPCVLCGSSGTVHPLDPCGHLVCAGCFSAGEFTACAICGRRLSPGGPFLALDEGRASGTKRARPIHWTRVDLVEDSTLELRQVRDDLVARTQALARHDGDDLRIAILATDPGSISWLPTVVPARENLAIALATALLSARPDEGAALAVAVSGRWSTTTDIARTLWSYSGGDPGLVLPRKEPVEPGEWWRPGHEPRVEVQVSRVRALPRWLRRATLQRIAQFELTTAGEDIARHGAVWKRLAERLHPFERVDQAPSAAVCFAALRGTATDSESALGRAMRRAAADYPDRVRLVSKPEDLVGVRILTFASLVEAALAKDDTAAAIELLRQRPGDFWRRLDHLARQAGTDPDLTALLVDGARATARSVAPAVILAAASQLAARPFTVKAVATQRTAQLREHLETRASARYDVDALMRRNGGGRLLARWRLIAQRQGLSFRAPAPLPGTPRRVFFPGGDVVRTWTEPERRDPVAAELAMQLMSTAYEEIARRARALPTFDLVAVDAGLAAVPMPLRERSSTSQFAGWTRGARLSLPANDGVLRLFTHWTDAPSTRVDLDLSCMFYAEDWRSTGHCDYTSLHFPGGAQHSGDLTSAPAPLGATEYIDLDLARLRANGVRWAIPVVFSYNDVPFERLDKAFAGFMLPLTGGEAFQADRVAQRFELQGRSRALVPMVVDLETQTLLWADLNLSTSGYAHSIASNRKALGRLGADVWDYFTAGDRTTVFDLVVLHAAARASALEVVLTDGRRIGVPLDGAPNQVLTRARRALDGHGDPAAVGGADNALVAAVRAEDLIRVGRADAQLRTTTLVAVGQPPGTGASLHVPDLLTWIGPAAAG